MRTRLGVFLVLPGVRINGWTVSLKLEVAGDDPGQLGSFRVAVEPDPVGPYLLCKVLESMCLIKSCRRVLNKEITKSDLCFRKSQETL